MEPIVSPWVIYGIEMLDKLNVIVLFGAIVTVFAFVFMAMHTFFDDLSDESFSYMKKLLYKIAIAAVVLMVTSVILPSRDTAYKMLACSYVTRDNIRSIGTETNEAIGTILDNIVTHINQIEKK